MANEGLKQGPEIKEEALGAAPEALLREHLQTLPKEVIDAISEFRWDEAVVKIGQKYNLHIDALGKLRFEALAASSGLTNPADFFETIKKELGLSDEQAISMTNDVNAEIFTAIRKDIQAKMGEMKSEEEEAKEVVITSEEEESIKEVGGRFNDLPDEIQEVIIAPDLAEKIGLLAEEYGVPPEKLDGLISTVLLAYLDPDNFATGAKNEFGLSEEKAAALAIDAKEAIWGNIEGKIKEIIAKEQMAEKVGAALERLDYEKSGFRAIDKKTEEAASEAAKKTLLEEKLKGQFRIPASQTAATPAAGATTTPPVGKPIVPSITPSTGGNHSFDPYREKPV